MEGAWNPAVVRASNTVAVDLKALGLGMGLMSWRVPFTLHKNQERVQFPNESPPNRVVSFSSLWSRLVHGVAGAPSRGRGPLTTIESKTCWCSVGNDAGYWE